MALKDLIADSSKLTEAAIENIVSDFIRYDAKELTIVLTPSGVALGNDAKVLVLLVAVLGWQYVIDEAPPVDTRPLALELLTGIPGGTLRPVLKKLKDSRLLAVADGHYSPRVANLDAIARIVSGERAVAVPGRNSSTKSVRQRVSAPPDRRVIGRAEKDRRKSGVPIRASLERLVVDGFFSETRSLTQVVAKLHDKAVIAKSTSLSGPIAELVRHGKLTRTKVSQGTRRIWGYKAI